MIHSTQGDKEEGKGGEHPRNAFSASALRKKKKKLSSNARMGIHEIKTRSSIAGTGVAWRMTSFKESGHCTRSLFSRGRTSHRRNGERSIV